MVLIHGYKRHLLFFSYKYLMILFFHWKFGQFVLKRSVCVVFFFDILLIKCQCRLYVLFFFRKYIMNWSLLLSPSLSLHSHSFPNCFWALFSVFVLCFIVASVFRKKNLFHSMQLILKLFFIYFLCVVWAHIVLML